MANNRFSGNSEGTVFRGIDGKYYQVINGRDVEVSQSASVIEGLQPGTVGTYLGTLQLPSSGQQSPNESSSGLILLGIGAVIFLLLSRN